jgi:hypothetical protein
MKLLVDVDRWDRADEAAQDAEVAGVRVDGFTYVRTERFTGIQYRGDPIECPACGGQGGSPIGVSGNSCYPDCDYCGNRGQIPTQDPSVTLSHRVAIFRHVADGEFILVPGRLEIAACLVARAPSTDDPPRGLRLLRAAEARHAVQRGGSYDLAFENWHWKWAVHPFGLDGNGERFAASIPGAERAQTDAFDELCNELGPIQPEAVPNALVRMGHGTADPVDGAYAIAFSGDGRWLATGDAVRIWDATTGRQVARISTVADSIAFSPDHVRIVAGSSSGTVIADIATGDLLKIVTADLPPYGVHRSVFWRPDGRILVAEALHEHWHLSLVDPETAQTIATHHWTQPPNRCLFAMSPNGKRATLDIPYKGPLAIRDTDTFEVARHVAVDNVNLIALADDVVYLVANDELKAVTTDDTQTITTAERISFIACSPDGRRVGWATSSGGWPETFVVHIYDRITQQQTTIANVSPPFAFSCDGTRIAGNVSRRFAAIWAISL